MKLSDLNLNPENPRTIDEAALKRLKKTVTSHGDVGGVTWNRHTKKLLGGNQRFKVIPPEAEITIVKEFKKPTKTGTVALGFIEVDGEHFFYREVDIADLEKEKAIVIAANKGAGEWDKPLLADWLLELDSKGWDIEDTGFSMQEFEDLCAPWKSDASENIVDPGEKLDQSDPKAKDFETMKCPNCGVLLEKS